MSIEEPNPCFRLSALFNQLVIFKCEQNLSHSCDRLFLSRKDLGSFPNISSTFCGIFSSAEQHAPDGPLQHVHRQPDQRDQVPARRQHSQLPRHGHRPLLRAGITFLVPRPVIIKLFSVA